MAKKHIRMIAAALAMLMALAMTACNAGAPAATGATTAAATTAAATTAATQAADTTEVQAADTDIDTSNPVSLTMYLLGDVPSDQERVYTEFNKLLTERINATLKTNYLSWGDWETQYSLILAAGENVDLMYTSDWAYYTTEAAKGSFYELTDEFLATYMPRTMETQDPASILQATIGGKLFAMPKNLAGLENESWIAIRKDLRLKYGMEEITNLDDLEKYFIAVAENEEGVLPYAASVDNTGFQALVWRQANQVASIANGDWGYELQGRDAKAPEYAALEYQWFAENSIALYELMRKWANLNFWSKNAINNSVEVRESFENGKSASLIWNTTIFAAGKQLRENNAEWDFEALDIFPGTYRKQALYTNDAIAIAATSPNPERAAMFLDLVKTDVDVHMALIGGIKDVHYILNADGTRSNGPDAGKYPWNPSTWCFNVADGFLPPDSSLLPEQVAFDEEQSKATFAPDINAFRFDVEVVKNELAALNALRDEYRPMLLLGMVEDIPTSVSEWKSKAEQAGLAKIEEELKKQYDAWYATMYQ